MGTKSAVVLMGVERLRRASSTAHTPAASVLPPDPPAPPELASGRGRALGLVEPVPPYPTRWTQSSSPPEGRAWTDGARARAPTSQATPILEMASMRGSRVGEFSMGNLPPPSRAG